MTVILLHIIPSKLVSVDSHSLDVDCVPHVSLSLEYLRSCFLGLVAFIVAIEASSVEDHWVFRYYVVGASLGLQSTLGDVLGRCQAWALTIPIPEIPMNKARLQHPPIDSNERSNRGITFSKSGLTSASSSSFGPRASFSNSKSLLVPFTKHSSQVSVQRTS
jgi:hypothetical protein